MAILDYFKGIWGILLVALLGILAIVFYFVFASALAVVLVVLAIITVIVVPYYFGKKHKPETKGNYSLDQVEEKK